MKHRKLTAALLALMMSAALAGCDDKTSTAENSGVNSETVSSAESSAAEDSAAEGAESKTEDSVAGAENSENGSDSKPDESSQKEESSAKDESSAKEESSAKDESSAKSESSRKDESSKSSSGFVVKPASADAKAVLEGFMKGMMNADRAALKKYSNFSAYFTAMRAMSAQLGAIDDDESSRKTMTDAELEDKLFGELEDPDNRIKSFKILRSAQNDTMRDEINKGIDELQQEIREADEEDIEKYKEYLEKLIMNYPKILECHMFEVELTEGSRNPHTEVIPVTLTKNGMTVDLLYGSAMSGYTSRAKLSSANSAAKTLYTAGNAALTDLDAEDADISVLDGTYTLKGSDFKNLSQVSINSQNRRDRNALFKALKYKMWVYFEKIEELEEISFKIERGMMKATALQKGDASDPVTGEPYALYGTYPHMMQKEDYASVNSIAKAMKYAEKTD